MLTSLSFRDALLATKQILSQSPRLKAEGLIETESEQLLIAVYRFRTGLNLSRLELFSKMGAPGETTEFLSKFSVEELLKLAERRVEGVPLQHLTGVQWFRDH
jgi:methylase of polypeptide subunit release factors